jgi:hypothetical protein
MAAMPVTLSTPTSVLPSGVSNAKPALYNSESASARLALMSETAVYSVPFAMPSS